MTACLARLLLLLLLVVGALSGCYYPHLVAGQSDIILRSQPIDRAVAEKKRERERLANLAVVPQRRKEEQRARLYKLDYEIERLGLVLEARRYGAEVIGLRNDKSYTVYHDTGGLRTFPTYVVSAAPKTELRTIHFNFLIVGAMPYKGFFIREWAEREAEQLRRQNYDVFLRPVSAYSTLGYFTDPVHTPMLMWPEMTLVGVVLHEMMHATIWVDDDYDFNESLAVFYERIGALDFLTERYGEDDPRVADAWDRWHDQEQYRKLIEQLRESLRALYSLELPYDEVLRQRDRLFREMQLRYVEMRRNGTMRTDEFDGFALRPLNNAVVQTLLMYNAGLDLYTAVWKAKGEDLRLALDVFKEAARHADPRAYLHQWLEAHDALATSH